ncbi:MAG: hypothetical protein GKR87_13690 [Kiritimatiellae bacterium]|nr:hypothetical protein [Kiritimatiellia bacterium]
MNNGVKTDLEKLGLLKSDMFAKDFLLTWEKSEDDLKATLYVAKILKELHKQNISTRIFDTGLAISIFRDYSTRTRFSFASAVNALGLAAHHGAKKRSFACTGP